MRTRVALATLAPALLTAQPRPAVAVDTALYAGLKYRMISPFRSGRSTAVTGVAGQPHLYYMGSTGGGVWKTEDEAQSARARMREVMT